MINKIIYLIILFIVLIISAHPLAGQTQYYSSDELSSYTSDYLEPTPSQSSSNYMGTSHVPGTTYQLQEPALSQSSSNYMGTPYTSETTYQTQPQQDEGLMPAPGYNGQSPISQSAGSSPNEFIVAIPYIQAESGQVRSDGTINSYPNIGSSGNAASQAFLSFDISRIPAGSTVSDVAMNFQGWDMVGTPFSKLGCLNIFPSSYRLLGSQSYSSAATASPYVKICSSGQLNSPISSPDLTRALQASLGQGKFQLRLQFDKGASGMGLSEPMMSRGYTTGESSDSGNDYLSNGYTVVRYSSNGLSDSTSYGQPTIQDIGSDRSLTLSDFIMNSKSNNSRYIILTPGVNLSNLGITHDMIERAIDPGQVRVATVAEGKPCVSDGKSGVWHRDGEFWICDTTDGMPAISPERVYNLTPPSRGQPMPVISPGRVFNLTPAPSRGQPMPVTPPGQEYPWPMTQVPDQASQDLIRIGIVMLTVTYSLPQQVQPQTVCDQQSCQAQSRAIGQAFIKDGKICQKYNDCNCMEGSCRCENVEKIIGEACDQQICQAKSRAVGTAYARGDKIYQKYSECNCVEDSCHCDDVEKVIGNREILPPPKITIPGSVNITFKIPDKNSLIETSEWGEVPVNQVLVKFHSTPSTSDLDALDNALNGQIVGYDDSINLYQIETSGKTEADLRDAISTAEIDKNVTFAFPNQKVYFYQSPMNNNPFYQGGRSGSYDIIGVQQAWNLTRDSGIPLSKVCIGVTDDGLYRGFGEFNNTKGVEIKSLECSELLKPQKSSDPNRDYSYVGSHGTGIMNVIAAGPDNNGLVGIASEPLKKNLTIINCNFSIPYYFKKAQFEGEPASAGLEAITEVTSMDAKILSISWGTRQADPGLVESFRDKFNRFADMNPNVLIICAAPDDVPNGGNKTTDGTTTCPGGFNFSNVITVGSITNSGKILTSSYGSSNYEITLAAPGEEVIFYKDVSVAYKNRHYGGTSMAVPMVVAAAAMIRSLNDSLTAAQIKAILVDTARTSINVGGTQVPIPKEVSGRVLAIDLAVQKVIADRKNQTNA